MRNEHVGKKRQFFFACILIIVICIACIMTFSNKVFAYDSEHGQQYEFVGNDSKYATTVTGFTEEKMEIPRYKIIITGIMVILLAYIFIQRRLQRFEKTSDNNDGKISWKEIFLRKNMPIDKTLILDILYVAGPVIVAFLFLKYVIIIGSCESASMEPTIMTGDATVSNGIAYINREPQRGEIVFFKNAQTHGEIYVKRIIGMPGEHISFNGGNVYIDGTRLDEEYIMEDIYTECNKEFDVPAGSYFMMGDNRDNSYDSRYWDEPYVKMDDIGGKIIKTFGVTLPFR